MAGSSEVNVSQVVKNLSKYQANVIKEVVYGCEAVQQEVINNAKARLYPGHGYRYGNLQGSIMPGGIEITDDNVTALIVANAEYASFVEFGTSRMRPIPYLTPALLENIRTFERAMQAAVRRAEAA